MAFPFLEASGTQTATLTTEHTLATITTVGTFQLWVDTSALLNGETVTLRAKYICLASGAEVLAFSVPYVHAQGEPMKCSLPIPSDISVKFTLRQDNGTGRAFPWKVLKLAA